MAHAPISGPAARGAVSTGRLGGVGLLLLAGLLALCGYGLMRLAWRIYLIRAWRQRRVSRLSRPQPPHTE